MHAFNIDSQVSNLDSQSQVWLLFWILIYYYWLRLLSINIRYSKQCMWLQLRAPWLMLFIFCTAFSLRGESVRGGGGDFKPLILIKFLIEAHCRLNIITGPFAGEYFFFQIWIYTWNGCVHISYRSSMRWRRLDGDQVLFCIFMDQDKVTKMPNNYEANIQPSWQYKLGQ